ncbi:unnamed protein product [Phytomonas sp. EM1]|nr:unnamed protein product [Phytomonas sp. EM1]|eukprot:CCW64887.1 unnamed protein product [Phytomonas sp. isolate EM1]
MLAAPATTTLDRIQSEIKKMRAERFQQTLEKESRNMQKKDQMEEKYPLKNSNKDPTSDILNHYRMHNKPNDAYYKGKEVIEGLTKADSLAYELFLNHLDEIMRPKSKEITKKYAEIFFPHKKMQHEQLKLLELLDKLEGSHQSEKEKLQQRISDETSPAKLSRLAWLNALDTCDEHEISFMWKRGILDADVIEALLASPVENSETTEGTSSHPEDSSVDGEAESELFLLEEKIQKIRQCYYSKELTSSIREAHLAGKPTCDLAPILQKVKQRQFDDISAKELRQLEKLEETPFTHLGEQPLRGVKLTASLLARALQPSNEVLFAVAQKDARVRQSLEGLEQIKRATILDPEFQAAVEFAHGLEELSVDGHVRPFGDEIGKESVETKKDETADIQEGVRRVRERLRSSRRKRSMRGSFGVRGAVARPFHAADIPYFFGSPDSVVPRKGDFNLPLPAPSPEEKAALRGRRRRVIGRRRFGN